MLGLTDLNQLDGVTPSFTKDDELPEGAIFHFKADKYNATLDALECKVGSGLEAVFGSTVGADTNDPAYLSFEGTKYIWMPHGDFDAWQTPDAAALDVAGDMTIIAKVRAEDYSNGNQQIFSKYDSGTTGSFWFRFQASSALAFGWVDDTGAPVSRSEIADDTMEDLGLVGGDDVWVRVDFDVDNGASNSDITFSYSTQDTNDPSEVTWTQIGSVENSGQIEQIQNSAEQLQVGARKDNNPQDSMGGRIYYTALYDGIEGSGGTLVASFQPDVDDISADHTTITSKTTGEVYTAVRTADVKKTAVVDEAKLVMGTDDFIEVDTTNMTFPGTGDYTIVTSFRCHDTSDVYIAFIGGYDSTNVPNIISGSFGAIAVVADEDSGGASTTATGGSPADGDRVVQTMRRISGTEISVFQNGVEGTPVTSGRLTNDIDSFYDDKIRVGGTLQPTYAEQEFMEVAMWNRALSDQEIKTAERIMGLRR